MASNIAAEKLLLSSFIRYPMRFFDFAEYLSEEDFTLSHNKAIFLSIRSLMLDKKSDSISKSKIISEAKSIGYDNFMSMTKNGEVLDDLISEKTNETDIGNSFLEVKRQSLRRAYSEGADNIQAYLSSTSDPLDKIIANVENMIVSKTVVLDYGRHAIKNMTKGLKDFVSDLAKNTGHLGLDIGFPIWQSRCGQIRNGSITFIAATSKAGKSQLGLRAGLTVAHKLNLPVLLVDSELSEADQKIRLVGMLAKVPYNIIETGYWRLTADELKAKNITDDDVERILEYGRRLRDDRFWEIAEKLPIDYMQISGMSVQEVIPHMRRWLLTKVKPSKDSKFPECLIIYDYIKLANVDELKGGKIAEYQVHGLNVAGLHDFCKDYNIPILTFGQTNREIDDNFNCVAGSKRIVENVDSISLIKKKTEEEKSMDPTGTHLMRVWAGRHGSGTDSSHINVQANLEYGEFTELNLSTVNFAEVKAKKLEDWKKKRKGKQHEDDDEED